MQIQTSVGPTGNINNQLQLAISFAYCLNIEKNKKKTQCKLDIVEMLRMLKSEFELFPYVLSQQYDSV
jgi:ABC-type microcin C transport system duplicated ATPase subunit YejF